MKNRTKNKINTLDLSAIEVYSKVLSGDLNRFPQGFWKGDYGLKNGIEITKYLIEDILKWDKNDIKENLIVLTFNKHKLAGMLKSLFKQSPFLAIDAVYPNEFKPYHLKNAPKDYWTDSTVKEAISCLMDNLSLNKEQLVSSITKQMLIVNDLGGLLDYCGNSPYKVLLIAFGDTFNPWDMMSAPNGYWTKESAINSIKNLIENELKWTDKEIKENLSKSIFQKYNLSGMLNIVFGDSPYNALNTVYPDKFSPSDLTNKPKCA